MPNYKSFIDDKEKMRDFYILSKQEFLQSYSYLTESEYDLTVKEASNDWGTPMDLDRLPCDR